LTIALTTTTTTTAQHAHLSETVKVEEHDVIAPVLVAGSVEAPRRALHGGQRRPFHAYPGKM